MTGETNQAAHEEKQMTPEERKAYAQRGLELYVKDWKIFIDTCSLLEENAEQFWLNIIPFLEKYKARVIVAQRVWEEVKKHSISTKEPDLAARAKDVIKKLDQLCAAKYAEIMGEERDSYLPDALFTSLFNEQRLNYRLLLITQDNKLAWDVLSINYNKAVRANPVHVKRLNKYGYLSAFPWVAELKEAQESVTRALDAVRGGEQVQPVAQNKPAIADLPKKLAQKSIPDTEKFRVCRTVSPIKDTPQKLSVVPRENTTVYTSKGGPVQLKKVVSSGGEGTIYTTNGKYVAKIYKKEKNTKRKEAKIQLMLTKQLQCEGICYPVEALYTKNKEFVGYLMPLAKGRELQKSVFLKPLLLKHFPDWKKRDTVELCITILKKILYLHERNIIMGDINPANILVSSPTEVYFVDTDSYQVEDFPCPVGTVNYTAPEIQGKNFEQFLRTVGQENFAVATLMFMIMLPGKPPYSQQGGGNPVQNIISMDFSYPFGENSNKKTPDGPWRYIWSHLSYGLKEAFYHTFRKGGNHATEETRLSAKEWIPIFADYLERLDNGQFGQRDPMSEELFPSRHKKNPKAVFVKCKLCGKEVDERMCQQGICKECLEKGEVYRCSRCGKEILYSNRQKYIYHSDKYDVCKECAEKLQKVWNRPICTACGKPFDITYGQYESFQKKGWQLPKRCRDCRNSGRTAGTRSTTTYRQTTYTQRSTPVRPSRPVTPPAPRTTAQTPAKKRNTGSFCFITTAVCEYYGKPDNCRELMTLRNFRDSWLQKQPGGEAMIAQYYCKAPLLVSKLHQSAQYAELCEMLMEQYIKPCLDMIAKGELEKCRNKYQEMVYHLEEKLKN